MPVRAVVFDIGGVLEVNPRTGWPARWADRLGLDPAAFQTRLDDIWDPGSTGAATLEEIERRTAEAFGLGENDLRGLMAEAWAEYVGTLNVDLCAYFASLRPRHRTGILSNSFVGARSASRRSTASRTCATRSSTRTRWAGASPIRGSTTWSATASDASRRMRSCSTTSRRTSTGLARSGWGR